MQIKTLHCAMFACMTVLTSANINAEDVKHHYPGIFIGVTDSDNETEFTFGLEYEYRFDKHWGVGATYEEINEAHHGDGVTVKLASLFYHPDNHWRFGLGRGKEKIGGAHPHSEDLTRVSACYDFHVGRFGIAPTFAVDFIDDREAYVLGVEFIMPF